MEAKLCSFRDQAIAGMMEQLLRSQGLHPRPLDTSASLIGTGQWYDLWIPKEEGEKAREIIIEAGHENALNKK